MEFIKKYSKKILILLLVIFSLTTCMKNCSKSNDLRNVSMEMDSIKKIIVYQDKIIDSLKFENKTLNIEKNIYKSTSDSYKSSLDKASSKRTTISVNVPKQEIIKKDTIK